jgi:hypothetical protein
LERITLEAALYIDIGSVDLVEETPKEPVVDEEIRESEEEIEEEIEELETLAEAET